MSNLGGGWRFASPYLSPAQPQFKDTLLGPLELVTPPSAQAVSTDRARTWCRVDTEADDDLLADLIARATRYCENEVSGQRQIMTATWDVPVLTWWDRPLSLPRPPLQSVTSVSYYDSAGSVQTLASSQYLVRTPWRLPGTIERAPSVSWPALQADRRQPVTIRFVAGWTATTLPDVVVQAVLLYVAWAFDNRATPMSQEMQDAIRHLVELEGVGSYS